MTTLTIDLNGLRRQCLPGATVLEAIEGAGIELPALCHDPRLKPCGSCRLCLVEIEGIAHPVASCTTPVCEGQVIRTQSLALEEGRRITLEELSRNYPADGIEQWPEKPLHRWFARYGLSGVKRVPDGIDTSHPYIQVDMSRCIDCYRCVRICAEVQGQFVWHILNRGAETKIVADSGVPLGQSTCVACGACVDTCPSGALEDKHILTRPAATTWTRTTCPYCGTGCEMMAGVSANRLVSAKPVPDSPVSHGHLCVKGRYAFDYVHAPDRVTKPMIRSADGWREVPWEEAIAHTVGALLRIRERHGSGAIGILGSARASNEENYLIQKFARVVIGTNNVDCCARVCHAPTARAMGGMLGTGAATNSYSDIEAAATILIFGANATENHPIVGCRIRQAALRGVRLIVVDPRQTELAQIAAIHLPVRPGTNVALLNALACVIVQENLVDAAFLAPRVTGWEEYCSFIRVWTPERVAEMCGVEAALIRDAARMYATAKPAMSFHGLGLTEHMQGTEGVMCLVNLALLTGNIGKPGTGVNPLRGQNNVQGSAHMGCEPGHLPGYLTLEAGGEVSSRVWGQAPPTARGLNLMEMMDAADSGQFLALWAMGYDVLLTNPGTAATRRALSKLEFLVVQDMFLNETAREFATVFLPAASSFEKDGTFMNAERRVQRIRQAMNPVGESWPDWQIVQAVAAAMGHREGFEFKSAEEIWNEVRTYWKAGAGISYARLEQGGIQWPCPSEDHPGTAVLHSESFSGKERAELGRIDWKPPDDEVSSEFPVLLTTGRLLFQFNAGTMTMRTPNTHWRPSDTLDLNPADASSWGIEQGQQVRVVSRYGVAVLPVRTVSSVRSGGAFATFHTAAAFLNQVTGPFRDNFTSTPQYKLTAIRIEKAVTSPG